MRFYSRLLCSRPAIADSHPTHLASRSLIPHRLLLHSYGRHLVLEYAEEERSVEAMREKLRAQQATAGDHEATAPKRKRRKGEIDQVDDLDL